MIGLPKLMNFQATTKCNIPQESLEKIYSMLLFSETSTEAITIKNP